ncbi:MAG: DpnD/PcfM family protein [Clostridium sp.]|nr:DpnD/PcfM family protein [Clostridium sp.]
MKIQDMVLVIKNIKGSEKNMLMTLEEYKEAYLFVSSLSREESAEQLKELFGTKFSEAGKGWAECYITANKSYYAKFCSGSDELQCFLAGTYNEDKEFQFDREESSSECLRALEEYNLGTSGEAKGFMFHYEPKRHDFEQGEVLHNFNGTDYKVMECYSKRNFLLLDMQSKQFLVAEGVHAYSRYPNAGEYTEENAEIGVDWMNEEYLSAVPSEIDFVGLRAEYCEPYHQTGDSFSIEIREVLSRVENIKAPCLGSAIDEAMKRYKTEKIVLDADDLKETRYIPVKNR